MRDVITVIGGGLAGSEAAWQIARRGEKVRLYEMRPARPTGAHRTDRLAEIVCSNSLKSDQPYNASWLLKEELRRLGSILIEVAYSVRVPAGSALAVDRERFASRVTEVISGEPNIELIREEVTEIPKKGIGIIASGPLTSASLSESIRQFCGSDHLYFYDAISPIVDADTIDHSRIYRASRYGKAADDYLNCPMNEQQYEAFYNAVMSAEGVAIHDFEEAYYFESCLPIEELARRGRDTLRFGPMRPVGLVDPRTDRLPYAVVQLRQEDLMQSSYNIVGFQNHLKFPDQKRIFRMIPGLENAEFLRFGQIHRNTYINAPKLLGPDLSLRAAPQVLIAGQLSGVEGYVECIATGLLAGLAMARRAKGATFEPPPRTTALGSLVHYITHADPAGYQPANISFDLLAPIDGLPRSIGRDR